MRLYNQQHRFYCGVDLHARSMFTHVLDQSGRSVFERDMPAGPEAFLDAVKPFRDGLPGRRLRVHVWGAWPDLVKLFGAAWLRP